MDVDADFYLSQAFESYLNKGTIDPKSQLSLADFSAKYRQMILHDRSYPTAAAAEAATPAAAQAHAADGRQAQGLAGAEGLPRLGQPQEPAPARAQLD